MKNIHLIKTTLVSIFVLMSSALHAEELEDCSKINKNSKDYQVICERETKVNRSNRTSPYPNTPSYAQGGNSDRYSTSQGWSRSNYNFWWGHRSSDIESTGYNTR